MLFQAIRKTCFQIADELKCHSIPIPFQNVIHHEFCMQEKEGLLDMHHFEIVNQPQIDFYSSITQNKLNLTSQEIAENSMTVCAQQVDFPKNIQTVYDAGARIFIEVGANATCTNWIQKNLKGKAHHAVAMNQKGKSDIHNLISLLAQLTSHGVRLDLSSLIPKVEESTKQRQFMKKIIPGGTPFNELFGDEKVQQRFSNVRSIEKKALSKRALVMADGDSNVFSWTIDATTEKRNQTMPIATNINKVEKRRSNMDPSTIEKQETTSIPGNVVGENGLRLQNYESGEQFEGKEIIFSQEDLEEFATGKIANVFGPEYAIIDTYQTSSDVANGSIFIGESCDRIECKNGRVQTIDNANRIRYSLQCLVYY